MKWSCETARPPARSCPRGRARRRGGSVPASRSRPLLLGEQRELPGHAAVALEPVVKRLELLEPRHTQARCGDRRHDLAEPPAALVRLLACVAEVVLAPVPERVHARRERVVVVEEKPEIG